MSPCEKSQLLDELTSPLGYHYDSEQDVFTSQLDAWQKSYGYGSIFDKAAPFFNMIFDCQPIYFDYDGKTWLIEFWKGQYGITTGSEIGVYHADTILTPGERKTAIFHAAEPEEYLPMTTELFYRGCPMARMSKSHWWLTIFSPGQFSKPEDLTLEISLRFPNFEMRNAFINALHQAGYQVEDINLSMYYMDVFFTFQSSSHHISWLARLHRCYVQWKNHLFCRLYRFVTRPFSLTCDKLLYLYYYLPFIFRRMLRLKRFKKRKR
ncbi:MAG: DUF4474 domain-containing protein [Lachnospiraceae bacterium]|nr:DUF4474 domain-containing protein [Lachnospiraceae bacterium]